MITGGTTERRGERGCEKREARWGTDKGRAGMLISRHLHTPSDTLLNKNLQKSLLRQTPCSLSQFRTFPFRLLLFTSWMQPDCFFFLPLLCHCIYKCWKHGLTLTQTAENKTLYWHTHYVTGTRRSSTLLSPPGLSLFMSTEPTAIIWGLIFNWLLLFTEGNLICFDIALFYVFPPEGHREDRDGSGREGGWCRATCLDWIVWCCIFWLMLWTL